MTKSNSEREEVLLGNDAVAFGALAAGVDFFAGYPITPSSEIAELLSREMPKRRGKFIQMEDEIASLGAVIGASLAGAKAMTATSGPGFSLMQEHIGFAAIAEVPCVIINVMRGGPSTGLPTESSQADIMQAKYGSHGDYPSIALMPDSVLESYLFTVKAFNLSEKYRTPVFVLTDEILGHMRENVILPPVEELEIINRQEPTVPAEWYHPFEQTTTGIAPMASFGHGYRFHVTGLTHDINGFPTSIPAEIDALMNKLKNKVLYNTKDLTMVEEYQMEDAEVCILAVGSVGRSARRAVKILRHQGIKAGMLRPQIIWPFPKQPVEKMLKQVEYVLVPEMNVGQVRKEVERLADGRDRIEGLNVMNSVMITAEDIVKKILNAEVPVD
ncbi:MAG: 2-oxoacid:acceptor oxidoreductase subunit alpha [Planctomycetes bacterium]|nr:2-oxoacid:acceptor oxidoreductase subunit alpha [Planctomycetota bacterium]